MAAFSNQHPPFLVDSLLLPNNPVKMTSFADEASDFNYFSSFGQFYSSGQLQEIAIDDNLHENTSRVERGIHNEASVIEIQSTDNSSSVVDHKTCYSDEQVTQNWTQMKKKRKANKEGSSSNSSSSKSVGEIKGKDQKKSNGVEEKQQKPYRRGDKKAQEEAPRDYIHVRARRGQATDSHSLAERVRRKKISEKMKLLQALVPGSDKVIGKALMLDEIINYVQSLQNQVEFLSMKLTSLTSMFFDFGADANAFMVGEQVCIALEDDISFNIFHTS
ncbi:hypothetical protein Nepgr_002951 [Nepenthes gracilis]|uniref:BHLH domain-containing protein n=1 Tax=Nepenthes gracilis TaxID=150966 RepID=A0AAD3RYM6_NEPGR|nr:hypothetical protein Nepgr_002951 [Nepenthes gracilis]